MKKNMRTIYLPNEKHEMVNLLGRKIPFSNNISESIAPQFLYMFQTQQCPVNLTNTKGLQSCFIVDQLKIIKKGVQP
jgi:hypothetical protein